MEHLRKGNLTRGKKTDCLKVKTVRLTVDVPQNIRDSFREAVERNGKTMKDVLKLYMQKYIWKQGELQKNRQRRREGIR